MEIASAAVPTQSPGPAGRRKAVAALVFGIIGLVLGIVVVPLLCAVLATTLASLALLLMDASGDPHATGNGRGKAVAGMVLGIVALSVWIPAVAAIAIAQG